MRNADSVKDDLAWRTLASSLDVGPNMHMPCIELTSRPKLGKSFQLPSAAVCVKRKEACYLVANSAEFLKRYKTGLLLQLRSKGFNVSFVSPLRSSSRLGNDPISIDWVTLAGKGKFYLFSAAVFLVKKSCSQDPCVIVTHTAYPNVILAALLTLKVYNKSNRFFIFVSGFGPSRIRTSLRIRLLGRIYLSLLRKASKAPQVVVVTLNGHDQRLVTDYNSRRHKRIMLVRESGVLDSDLKLGNKRILANETLGSSENRLLRVGYLGRFLLEKGIDQLSNIIAECNLLFPEKFEFILSGTTDPNNSSSLATLVELTDQSNVNIITDAHYAEIFQQIDVLLFPSLREGHPLYVLRSMSFGVVPIVYPVAGSTADIIHEYNGLVARHISPNAMIAELMRLAESFDLLKALSKNAYRYASLRSQDEADSSLAKLIEEAWAE